MLSVLLFANVVKQIFLKSWQSNYIFSKIFYMEWNSNICWKQTKHSERKNNALNSLHCLCVFVSRCVTLISLNLTWYFLYLKLFFLWFHNEKNKPTVRLRPHWYNAANRMWYDYNVAHFCFSFMVFFSYFKMLYDFYFFHIIVWSFPDMFNSINVVFFHLFTQKIWDVFSFFEMLDVVHVTSKINVKAEALH